MNAAATVQEPERVEVEAASRAWVESGPGAACWELVCEEQRQRIRARMRQALLAGRRAGR